MTMRNTILALVAAGLLTVASLAPALAIGLDCAPPNLDGCPIYGVYGNPMPNASAYEATPRQIRHSQMYGSHRYRSHYPNHG